MSDDRGTSRPLAETGRRVSRDDCMIASCRRFHHPAAIRANVMRSRTAQEMLFGEVGIGMLSGKAVDGMLGELVNSVDCRRRQYIG